MVNAKMGRRLFYCPTNKGGGDHFFRYARLPLAMMLFHLKAVMSALCHHLKIVWVVVRAAAVNVVNVLPMPGVVWITMQRPAYFIFGDKPMLSDPAPRITQAMARRELPHVSII